MSNSPESVVRRFFAAWADPKADELGSFFTTTPCGSTVRKVCAEARQPSRPKSRLSSPRSEG